MQGTFENFFFCLVYQLFRSNIQGTFENLVSLVHGLFRLNIPTNLCVEGGQQRACRHEVWQLAHVAPVASSASAKVCVCVCVCVCVYEYVDIYVQRAMDIDM